MTKTPKDEFVVFSDFHAHNFKFGAKRVLHNGKWLNSRLVDSIHVLRDIKDYCYTNGIDQILFGGDLFHRRTVLHTDVFNEVFSEIEDLCAKYSDLIAVPGNHDFADRSGSIHSLSPFNSIGGFHLLDKVSCKYSKSFMVVGVPYTDDPEKAKQYLAQAGELVDKEKSHGPGRFKFRVLLAHLGMQGAKVGSDYVLISPSDIQVADVPYDKFDLCLFGHYHQHQRLFENGWFIGSTHHHNWGDANTKRGFLHVTVFDDNTFEFKQIETSAPRFLKLDEDNLQELNPRDCDFVRYHAKPGEKVPEITSQELDVVEAPLPEEELKIELPEEYLNPHAIVDSWVDTHGAGSERLKELGKRLLAEAEGQNL